MIIFRLLRRFVLMSAVDGDGGGGGATDAPAPDMPAAPAAPEPQAAAPAAAPATAPAAPKQTMQEAISAGLEAKRTRQADPSAPRNPNGTFVPKVPGEKVAPGTLAAPAPVQPAAAPAADPTKPAADPEDITAMPEGLGAAAKVRFEKLVGTNKELSSKADMLERQVSYVRDTFHQHAVKPEQFEQAATVIGMINKGDYRGAKAVLETQLKQLSILSGEPAAQIDALADFPDLRQAVDGMQITEAHAMELARSRAQQHMQQQGQQREQQAQQSQQQERQAVSQGTNAVDAFCKRMQGTDLDYAAIEAQLLPVIPTLLQGVSPQHWARIVETQYNLIKKVAGSARATPTPTNPLRPTGHGSLSQAPKSMFEAMWGASAR